MHTLFFVQDEDDDHPRDCIIVDGAGYSAYKQIYAILEHKHPLYAEACEDEDEEDPVRGLIRLVEDVGAYCAYETDNIVVSAQMHKKLGNG